MGEKRPRKRFSWVVCRLGLLTQALRSDIINNSKAVAPHGDTGAAAGWGWSGVGGAQWGKPCAKPVIEVAGSRPRPQQPRRELPGMGTGGRCSRRRTQGTQRPAGPGKPRPRAVLLLLVFAGPCVLAAKVSVLCQRAFHCFAIPPRGELGISTPATLAWRTLETWARDRAKTLRRVGHIQSTSLLFLKKKYFYSSMFKLWDDCFPGGELVHVCSRINSFCVPFSSLLSISWYHSICRSISLLAITFCLVL